MDEHRFDALARALGAGHSRRHALGLLAGAASLAGVGLAEEGADAKQGRHRSRRASGQPDGDRLGTAKKKNKKCKGGKVRCPGSKACADLNSDSANCGSCGTACTTGQACQNGRCRCAGCDGCCDGVICRPGTDDNACGSGGGSCGPCADGQFCQDGACACGERSCPGCCDRTACRFGNEDHACGVFGEACAACHGGRICNDGICECPPGQADCSGTCTSLSSVQNCGGCGNVCPGVGKAFADASCAGGTCVITCRGDHYDVDGDPGNGCENDQSSASNHSVGTAKPTSPASQDCFDSSTGFASGTIVSDRRVHASPAVPGFSTTTGAAPQVWKVVGTGGACENNLDVTLGMVGAPDHCYRLDVSSDAFTGSAPVVGGFARVNPSGRDKYTSNTEIFFAVSKICDTAVVEARPYTIGFRL